ncbi:DNA-binding protein, excisionase family [Hydrogenobaculum sp. SN]|nr:DNA binding domain protein, excisionase family [Hydrogenobaculum sp. 3684]AEG45887.1 DNA binding domain protein, excisionase family [Hydrogenobaculum sp. SHO]AGG14530.1 DNA binding domain protein, excisionase family [Hydrogenobaculum sp. HO]AGH92831.1 DNA-binding protein, excisionase family [Hydrogenobaculum sp. SN]
MNTKKKYLSVKELAELLGCSTKTVYRMIQCGRFWTEDGDRIVKLNGAYRIPLSAIKRLEAEEI